MGSRWISTERDRAKPPGEKTASNGERAMDAPRPDSYFDLRNARPTDEQGTESTMIDLLLWGGLSTLIVGLAIIAARKPTP